MQVKQILSTKPFELIKIEIVVESPAELQYMRDKIGGWSGSGTYPLFALLDTLVQKSQ